MPVQGRFAHAPRPLRGCPSVTLDRRATRNSSLTKTQWRERRHSHLSTILGDIPPINRRSCLQQSAVAKGNI